MSVPKILITGSNGLLGQHLIQLLKKRTNCEILATARGENRLSDKKGYTFNSMDITDEAAVKHIFEKEKPDFLIHGAALTQVDDCEKQKQLCWQTNVVAIRNLIAAARQQQTFFTFISTDFIFDGTDGPYSEDALPYPINYYGLSKLAAEMLLEGSGLAHTILRTVLVYGVSEDPFRSNIVLWVKKSLEGGKQIHVVDDQWRTPTLVQDLAMGCKLVIEGKMASETIAPVYNISGKELLTPYQMALKIADFFKLDASLITRADASSFSQVAKRPAKTGFLLDRAEEGLHYNPHSFEEGLKVVEEKLQASGSSYKPDL